jgi:uncharacterized protein YggE
MKLVRLGGVLLVLAALLALPAAAAAPAEQPDGITVTGTETIDVAPDVAEWSFGVHTRAESARAALSANSSRVRRVIAALRSAGVARDDIRTAYVSLYPNTSEDGEVIGYFANNTVHATARNIGRSGAVIDAAVRAGANEVSGPSMTRSNREALYERALTAAYDRARAKAEALAGKLGVSLGAPTAVVEGGLGGAEPVYGAEAELALAKDVPIEPGQTEIAATVTVTFAIA